MMKRLVAVALIGLAAGAILLSHRTGTPIDRATHPGGPIYRAHCAACHEGGVPKAPHRQLLSMMPAEAILKAMNGGIMAKMAAGLNQLQRRQIAEYLTGVEYDSSSKTRETWKCIGKAARFDMLAPPATAGWGYDTRRFIAAADAGLNAAEVTRLKLKWAFAFPGALRARSQPVVAMGAVFVGSQNGMVYALDLGSGCVRWKTQVSAEVRTAIVVEPWPQATKPSHPPRVFFGDLLGRVYALDALTGKVLWDEKLDERSNAPTITGTPAFHDGMLYVPISSMEAVEAGRKEHACCTFRGSVVALDAATGNIKWRHYTIPDAPSPRGETSAGTAILAPSGASVWTSPAIDTEQGVLYHGSGNNYSTPADRSSDALFAVDLLSGRRIWQYQETANDAWNHACAIAGNPNCPIEAGPDFDLSASPLVINAEGDRRVVVAGFKSGDVVGFDPAKPATPLWHTRIGTGSIQGGIHFGMAAEGSRLYVPIVDVYASSGPAKPTAAPGLYAIDALNGTLLWSAPAPRDSCHARPYCDPGISAAVTAIPGVVFAGHLDGWLRAYDGTSGKIIWEADTTVPVISVNGDIAHGGSMSGPGPTVANGNVIVNSGYGIYSHMPGNALLVYSVEGK
jgi:polyvinyl alcohol dehydrogenase (cytochrome)